MTCDLGGDPRGHLIAEAGPWPGAGISSVMRRPRVTSQIAKRNSPRKVTVEILVVGLVVSTAIMLSIRYPMPAIARGEHHHEGARGWDCADQVVIGGCWILAAGSAQAGVTEGWGCR